MRVASGLYIYGLHLSRAVIECAVGDAFMLGAHVRSQHVGWCDPMARDEVSTEVCRQDFHEDLKCSAQLQSLTPTAAVCIKRDCGHISDGQFVADPVALDSGALCK